jgi:hypothetical protein
MPPIHDEEEKGDGREDAASEHGSTFGLTEIGAAEKVRPAVDDTQGLDDKFIAEIMMNLDSTKIGTLKRAFEQNDDEGLELAEFVHVMTNILDMDHSTMTDEQVSQSEGSGDSLAPICVYALTSTSPSLPNKYSNSSLQTSLSFSTKWISTVTGRWSGRSSPPSLWKWA